MRSTWIASLLLLHPAVAAAGDIQVVAPGYQVALTPVTHDTSAHILDVQAAPAAAGEVRVYVQPLLWNSPDPPDHFGTLAPGQYELGFSFKLPNTPTELQVSWVGDAGYNQIHTLLDIAGLSREKWYRATGVVEVAGSDWVGRYTLVVKSTTDAGSHDTDIHAQLDDLTLLQGASQIFRRSFDLEQDPVGALPGGMNASAANATGASVRVVDNLPWQRLPDWYQRDRVQMHTRLNASHGTYGVMSAVFADAPVYLGGMGLRSWTTRTAIV